MPRETITPLPTPVPTPEETPTPSLTITSLYTLNSGGRYLPGDAMLVVMNGSPGALATFDVVDLGSGIPMDEVSPGRYEGAMLVDDSMQIHAAALTGHLEHHGAQASFTASTTVTLGYGYEPSLNAPPTVMFVKVSYPVAGQAVSPSFSVTGSTVPFAQVAVVAFAPPPMNVTAYTPKKMTFLGSADATGQFTVPVQIEAGAGVNLVVRVIATDAQQNSRQIEMRVTTAP